MIRTRRVRARQVGPPYYDVLVLQSTFTGTVQCEYSHAHPARLPGGGVDCVCTSRLKVRTVLVQVACGRPAPACDARARLALLPPSPMHEVVDKND